MEKQLISKLAHMLGNYYNTLYEECSWVTSLRTTAWWMRLLISSSDVAPCLLVFRRMRATFPSSSPEWGRSGSPSPTSSRCVFSVKRSSSIGSGKVKALPLAPKRCLARWAVESKGADGLFSFLSASYLASIVMQVSVVMQGLAQIISMMVTFRSLKRRGPKPIHMSFAKHCGGSLPAAKSLAQLAQRGTSHSSHRNLSPTWFGLALQRWSCGENLSVKMEVNNVAKTDASSLRSA